MLNKKKGAIIAVAVLAAVIVAVIVVLISKSAVSNSGKRTAKQNGKQIEVYPTQSPEEVMAYYESFGEVTGKTPAKKAKGLIAEAEALAMLQERGFDQYAVTCPFALEGDGQWNREASEDCDDKHPTYETTYLTEDFTLWHVYLNGDSLLATSPAIDARAGTSVIYSEKERVLSYDTNTDSFYEVAPNASSQELRVVERIDAELLEAVTAGKEDAQ